MGAQISIHIHKDLNIDLHKLMGRSKTWVLSIRYEKSTCDIFFDSFELVREALDTILSNLIRELKAIENDESYPYKDSL